VSDAQQNRFEVIASTVGFPWSIYYADDPNHGTELRPSKDGSVLGRVLYALGSARNKSNFDEPSIPPYVFHHPAHARRFVEIWALHHMTEYEPPTLTVPSKLSGNFSNMLEAIMSDPLSWTVNRVNPRQFIIVDAGKTTWTK
jgi:hypothetical protein